MNKTTKGKSTLNTKDKVLKDKSDASVAERKHQELEITTQTNRMAGHASTRDRHSQARRDNKEDRSVD